MAIEMLKTRINSAIEPHWSKLEQRERVLVSSLAGVVVIALLYLIFWRPIAVGIEERAEQITAQEQLLQLVREQAGQLQALQQQGGRQPAATSSGSLSQRVTQAASSAAIEITRIQPQGDDLLVAMNEVDFNQLINMLADLQARHGVTVVALDIATAGIPGQVRVRKLQVRG